MRPQAHDRSRLTANHFLDPVDAEAVHGFAVDRVDDFAGLHSRPSGRHRFDRLDDDPTVFELIDVDADAAEVSARERFVQPLDLARREIDGVRIAHRVHDAAQAPRR